MDHSKRPFGQQIARAAHVFEKRRTQHGRKWVVVFLNEETIVIAMHGSLTAGERNLVRTPAGVALVREFHQQLFSKDSVTLFQKIKMITAMEVRDTTAEIEPTTGSVVQLFTTNTAGEEFPCDPSGPAQTLGPGDGPPCWKEENARRAVRTTGCLVRGGSPAFHQEELRMKTDSQLQKDVMDEIKWEPSTTAAQIGVSAVAGVVTLTGTVATYAEKWAVERAAQRVQGVKGSAEEITIKLNGVHARTDAEIAAAAVTSLKWHVWVPSDIQPTVAQGWVTLKGSVNWEYQRTAARDAVCFMPGVKGVTNDITIKPAVQPAAVKDAIEKALVRNAEIDAGNVRVAAEGGTVTLSGSVQSWGEKAEAGTAAWNAPGVNTVRNDIAVSCP